MNIICIDIYVKKVEERNNIIQFEENYISW